MDLEKLRDLVKLMVDNDLSEIEVRDQDATTLYLRRGPEKSMVVNHQPVIYNGGGGPGGFVPTAHAAPMPAGMPQPGPAATSADATPPGAKPGTLPAGLVAIESPMVGTFYSAPNPDTPAFVKPGSQISADSVVCLIEAMKVFNEIKAEKSGSIEQVLVKNGEAVEFGQKLFLVRPA